MEQFHFDFNSSKSSSSCGKHYTIAGVVASGNLEVLVESDKNTDKVSFDVNTTTSGFHQIWQALLNNISSEYNMGGLKISINDAGAVPAVVGLRIKQAFEKMKEECS